MQEIIFGTSGFRGVLGDSFTKQNLQKIAYALCQILKEDKKTDKPINIGFDNRFMGNFFAKWICEVFVFYGFKLKFFYKPVPSPLIAFEAKNAYLGIQITASHNHYYYNGVKLFLEGGKESDDNFNKRVVKIAEKVEHSKIKTLEFDKAKEQGLIVLTDDIEPYCNSIVSFINSKNIRKKNLKVLFNAFHGSNVECIRSVCEKIGLENYYIMKNDIDPYFDFKVAAPYVHNISDQIAKLRSENYDVGFAFDADGDRITILDKTGEVFDCNMISAVFYYYFTNKGIRGNFVKNYALTQLIDKISEKFGLKIFNAKVGFKNIASVLSKEKNMIMGAESNGIAIKEHLVYKDGLLPAIILLDILSAENKSIKKLIEILKKEMNYPCEVVEHAYPISRGKKAEIFSKIFKEKNLPLTPEKIVEVSYVDGFKMTYNNGYWGVIRFSGTENVVRIFAEMKNKQECSKYIKIYEEFIGVNQKQI